MDAEQIVTDKVKSAISASQADLMKGLGDLFSQIRPNQNNSNDAQLSKISTLLTIGDFPKFKGRSNEGLFKQNSKVLCKLDEVEKSLELMNVDKVRDDIMEAKDMIKHRQKIIQLADSSELG